MYDSTVIAGLTLQKAFAEKWKSLDPQACVILLQSIQEALDYVTALPGGEQNGELGQVDCLVTGSLHLVGGALGVLEGATAL
jgi:hypothetical protein